MEAELRARVDEEARELMRGKHVGGAAFMTTNVDGTAIHDHAAGNEASANDFSAAKLDGTDEEGAEDGGAEGHIDGEKHSLLNMIKKVSSIAVIWWISMWHSIAASA